ncbi:MAG: Phage protein Gp37/Gp68 [Verrucomicrobia bacterium ADurb.Bin474]|nr:MAG: Phage protein Gp37/Gp68 [Verrucomicrobia bacterium ADurb.Bin474]
MAKTKIEWAQRVWNPITGCTKISDGCRNCYAERMAKRLAGRCGYPKDDPFRVTFHPERMNEPLLRKKPTRYFVCSMGDLFHDEVPDEFIVSAYQVMLRCPQHLFIVLTKRPERIHNFVSEPLPNVIHGTTVESQEFADKRIPELLKVPGLHMVSVEPMLGPVDMRGKLCHYTNPDGTGSWFAAVPGKVRKRLIDLVICGCESGPGRRPMATEWAIDLRNQCKGAGAAFFMKQMELNGKVSHNINDFPTELRVREWIG